MGVFDRGDALLGAAILLVALAMLLPRLRALMADDSDDDAKPAPRQPRSVERFVTLIVMAAACLVASMWVESREIMLSEPGGVIEGVLRKLDALLTGATRVLVAIAFHSMAVDHVAYRSFTLVELHTNKPAPWRLPGEFQPFDGVNVRAAAVLGYWLTWAVVVFVFGTMAG